MRGLGAAFGSTETGDRKHALAPQRMGARNINCHAYCFFAYENNLPLPLPGRRERSPSWKLPFQLGVMMCDACKHG